MKYAGMPLGMWMLFHRSFTRQLTAVLGQSAESAKATERAAKQEYRRIIARVPDFEPGDRFQMNLVNCAMLCAYVLHMPKRPTVQTLTDYYAKSMMTPADWITRWRKQVKRRTLCANTRWRPAGRTATAGIIRSRNNKSVPFQWRKGTFFSPFSAFWK